MTTPEHHPSRFQAPPRPGRLPWREWSAVVAFSIALGGVVGSVLGQDLGDWLSWAITGAMWSAGTLHVFGKRS